MHANRDEVVLAGDFVEGSGPRAGVNAPVRYLLHHENRALIGSARGYFKGHSV